VCFIKAEKGRLELPDTPDQYVADRLRLHPFSALPIQPSHFFTDTAPTEIYTDPFDRLLVAQSQMEGLPILTADIEIRRYQVEVIW
jgi:PIN domain nuclease of toxin-antitoxin system